MTNNREDYLTAIFKLTERDGHASNRAISEFMNIARGSVSEMLKKLSEEGMVSINGRYIELTDKAEEIARELLSKHRLWETFLQSELNYGWQDVHAQADLLEHATDERLMRSLNEYLGKPKYCPHGSRIYINSDENDEDEDGISLSDLSRGERGIITKVDDVPDFLAYMDRLCLGMGMELEVTGIDGYDGSVQIRFEGGEAFISEKAKQHMFVRRVPDTNEEGKP